MDFLPPSFDVFQQGFPQDISTYHGLPMLDDFDNGCTNDYDLVAQDQVAQSSSPWAQAAMHRFLSDTQRPSLYDPSQQQVVPSNAHAHAQPVVSIPPVASHHRQESPFPSRELSSCSSARSPGAETELFSDVVPSTPPSMSMFTSFQTAPMTSFQPQSPFFLSGVGGFPIDSHSYFSVSEAAPVEEDTNDWKPSQIIDFGSPPPRSCTLRSQPPMCHHLDVPGQQPSSAYEHKHAASPALSAAVKEESSLPETLPFSRSMSGAYPTPSVRDSEDSDNDIEVASPASSDGDGDDDEYRPASRQRASPVLRRTTRNKRDAPKSLEKGSPKRVKTSSASATQTARPLPPSSGGHKGPFSCTECTYSSKDEAALHTHVKKQHTRPFICVFRFAGCGSTFASKNEWKRHVTSQHLVLHYWLCDIDSCAQTKNTLSAGSKPSRRARARRATAAEQTLSLEPLGPPLPNGAIFNRKDLYTQHIRRMHTLVHAPKAATKSSSSTASSKKHTTSAAAAASAQWDDTVKSLQTTALRERCHLPTDMDCPVPHCALSFSGTDAWDQRMEHVARHLEAAALGEQAPVVFGGPGDPSLMSWATRPDVAVVRPVGSTGGSWVLNNPLRAASEGRGVGRRREVSLPSSSSMLSETAAKLLAGSEVALLFEGVGSGGFVKREMSVEEGEEDAEGEEE